MGAAQRIAAFSAAVLGTVGAAGLAGLRVQPEPFADYPRPSATAAGSVPLPRDLPAPVERWLRDLYGEQLPVIDSVVVTGRALISPFGIPMAARFRFFHDCGRSYRHYIEATVYGRPALRVNERYVDGQSLIEIPLVGTDEGPKVEQAANIGMWAELACAAPAVLACDDRVTWRPIDAVSAVLVVPLGPAGHDEMQVRFDPDTGRFAEIRAWRYRDSKQDAKTLWTARVESGPDVPGTALPAVGSATWADQRRPWAVFTTEDIRYNVDLAGELLRHGP